jgi:hypothetical protein
MLFSTLGWRADHPVAPDLLLLLLLPQTCARPAAAAAVVPNVAMLLP